MILSKEEYEMYKKIEDEVSEAHPYKCVCGKIPTTGLHERNCSAFRKCVEKKFLKWMKEENEEKMGVGFKTVIIDELPSFEERAKKFKEAVLKAEKKYGVSIKAGYINSWDDAENLLIQELSDCEVINEVYFDTLRKEL